jgi:NADH-quinone oxidoreductase subunit M
LPFIGLIVFCGVYPKPMLDRIEPSVKALMDRVELVTGYVAPEPVIHEQDDTEQDDTEQSVTDHGDTGHSENEGGEG